MLLNQLVQFLSYLSWSPQNHRTVVTFQCNLLFRIECANQCDLLVKKVNAIDTTKLANKSDYNSKIKGIEGKIANITG